MNVLSHSVWHFINQSHTVDGSLICQHLLPDTRAFLFLITADLVNLPEEPIEEEEEEEEDGEEDMDADDRVVEYRDRERGSQPGEGGLRSRLGGSFSESSDSDEMDYDLELKMISTPSPKKSMKMTMYADEVENNLKTIRYVRFKE